MVGGAEKFIYKVTAASAVVMKEINISKYMKRILLEISTDSITGPAYNVKWKKSKSLSESRDSD